MTKIPKQLYTIKSNIVFVLFLTIFGILFAVLYAPSYGYDTTYWRQHNEFIISILASIVLVVTALSRTLMILLTGESRLREREFLLWILMEWLVCCLFCDLFLCLYMHRGYFEILLPVLMIGFSVALFPYTIHWMMVELQDRSDRLQEAQSTIEALRQGMAHEDEVIQFFDDKKVARLLVDLDTVYSVESAGNYVNIVYDDKGKLQRFSLRNTMKGVEPTCEQHGLVRCHRSYYINLRKVKLIRKESNGAYAEMQREGLSDIPISKIYAAEVAQQFSTRI